MTGVKRVWRGMRVSLLLLKGWLSSRADPGRLRKDVVRIVM